MHIPFSMSREHFKDKKGMRILSSMSQDHFEDKNDADI
jgi:hypothetical protein